MISHYLAPTGMEETMENDIKTFFKRIVLSLVLGFSWLIVALSFGIYTGLLLPEHGVHTPQIIFYIFLLISLVWVVFVIRRMWNNKPKGLNKSARSVAANEEDGPKKSD
ncbi:MAG: hypothetical protein QM731_19345 [Chitinophagaceae bacterium]